MVTFRADLGHEKVVRLTLGFMVTQIDAVHNCCSIEKMDLGIVAHSSVGPEGIYRNGARIYTNKDGLDFDLFAKEAYSAMAPAYPKFFKMDELSKLAFLTTEVLLSEKPLDNIDAREDIAVIVGNKHSSIASDRKHYDLYKDRENYFPSPAVFVYTLPNIMLGEICIRHNINGENACFLMDQFDTMFLFRYVKELFDNQNCQACITGWIDYNGPSTYEGRLLLVEKWNKERNFVEKFDENFNKLI